ncbi:tetrameric acyl-CoA thioesterase [Xanthomonas sp. Mitacek01]|nr:tetrameric acyl-CoA thioesterase [Xanthomonas sp. Mitacek01]
MTPRRFRLLMNLWPPFLCAGIRVTAIDDRFRHARVELRQRWYNRNYVGTHFGGSLFAMTDPFWMIMTLRALGSEHVVWDKAAEIEFIRLGRGTVHAHFDLDDATVESIRAATADGSKHLHWFETDVLDAAGEPVARIRKQVYVRRKRRAQSEAVGDSTR